MLVGYFAFIYFSFVFSVFIHELGHVLASGYVGYRVKEIYVSPLSFSRNKHKWKIKFISFKLWGYVDVDRPVDGITFRSEAILFSGGIACNILFGILGIVVGNLLPNYEYIGALIFVSWISLVLGLVNLVPMKLKGTQLYSDSYHLLRLYKEYQRVRKSVT